MLLSQNQLALYDISSQNQNIWTLFRNLDLCGAWGVCYEVPKKLKRCVIPFRLSKFFNKELPKGKVDSALSVLFCCRCCWSWLDWPITGMARELWANNITRKMALVIFTAKRFILNWYGSPKEDTKIRNHCNLGGGHCGRCGLLRRFRVITCIILLLQLIWLRVKCFYVKIIQYCSINIYTLLISFIFGHSCVM